MCAICVAIPATAVVGMTLDQKQRAKHPQRRSGFFNRPILLLTVLALLFLLLLSALLHTRQ